MRDAKRVSVAGLPRMSPAPGQRAVPAHDRPEREIVRAVLDFLPALGVYAWRNQSGMMRGVHKDRPWVVRMGKVGVSDIVGFDRATGRIVCVECKRPGKPLSRHQEAFGDLVRSSGGLFIRAECVQDVVDAFARARGR